MKKKAANLSRLRASFLWLAISLFGCAGEYKPASPVQWELYHTAIERTENLLIMLPGINNSLSRFEEEDFFNNIKNYAPGFDVMTVDADIAYYMQGSLISELHQHVFPAAKQQGYRNIVLGGISLGGYGSIWFNHEHAQEIKGLLLIAPYLGEPEIISEINTYSSVSHWRKHHSLAPDDFSSRVWYWIDDDIDLKRNNTLLAIGEKDKMLPAARILAKYLPTEQIVIGSGGHNWYGWRKLWHGLLADKSIDKLFN